VVIRLEPHRIGTLMYTLGISAFYHDSAAALLRNGEIVAAAEEERFSRIKHDSRIPVNAVSYCLAEAGITIDDITRLAYYEDPTAKLSRIISTYAISSPKGFKAFGTDIPRWLATKYNVPKQLGKELGCLSGKLSPHLSLVAVDHHLSHAASAFFPSPFRESLILTVDGVGEWATTSAALGLESDIKVLKELRFPHSLGLLYSTFTAYLGFRVNSGEYKVMGLAPYGKPVFASVIKDKMIDIRGDGSFRLNMHYFDYTVGTRMYSEAFLRLF